MAEALGWSQSEFDMVAAEVRDAGMAYYDRRSHLWFLPKAIVHNPPANPNVVRSWRACLSLLPECELRERIVHELKLWLSSEGAEAWTKAFDEALGLMPPMASPNPSGKPSPKPLVKPSPIQEQEQEQKIPNPLGSGAAAPPAPTVAVQQESTVRQPDTADVIFSLGVPLLTAANVNERNARSMLGLMRKTHGDVKVILALQRCATEKPLQPVAWLQAVLQAPSGGAAPTPPKGDRIAAANAATVRKFAERTTS